MLILLGWRVIRFGISDPLQTHSSFLALNNLAEFHFKNLFIFLSSLTNWPKDECNLLPLAANKLNLYCLMWSVIFVRSWLLSVMLDNWLRELRTWCPALEVLLYYGSQDERRGVRADLLDGKMDDFQILLTTSVYNYIVLL